MRVPLSGGSRLKLRNVAMCVCCVCSDQRVAALCNYGYAMGGVWRATIAGC